MADTDVRGLPIKPQVNSTGSVETVNGSGKTDVGLEKNTPPTPSNDYEPGKPKILSKAKFCMAYEITASQKYVVVERFSPELFMYQAFLQWAKQAEEYGIYTVKERELSVCLLRYGSVREGEEAYVSLKACLTNEDCLVRHPRLTQGVVQWLLNATNTGLQGIMNQLYEADSKCQDIFGKRSVMLEHMPSCTSEELLLLFPEAINIVNFTLDEYVKDTVVVELHSVEDAEKFIDKFNGATVKEKIICASVLLPRLMKILDSFKKFNKKHGVDAELSDETRLESILEFIKLHDEKDSILNRTDISAYDKERRFFEIEGKWDPLQRSLFSDAKRRYDNNVPLAEMPENVPESMQRLVFGKGCLDNRDKHREASRKMEEEKRKRKEEENDEKIRKAEEAAFGVMLIPKNPAPVTSKEKQGRDMIPVPKKGCQKRTSDSDPAPQFAKKAFKKPIYDQYDSQKVQPSAPSLLNMNLARPEPRRTPSDQYGERAGRAHWHDDGAPGSAERGRYGDEVRGGYGGRERRRDETKEPRRPPLLRDPIGYRSRDPVGDFRGPGYAHTGGYGQPQQALDYEKDALEDRVKALTDQVVELKAAMSQRWPDAGPQYGPPDSYGASSYDSRYHSRRGSGAIPRGRGVSRARRGR